MIRAKLLYQGRVPNGMGICLALLETYERSPWVKYKVNEILYEKLTREEYDRVQVEGLKNRHIPIIIPEFDFYRLGGDPNYILECYSKDYCNMLVEDTLRHTIGDTELIHRCYWWSLTNHEARIKAFNILIDIYTGYIMGKPL